MGQSRGKAPIIQQPFSQQAPEDKFVSRRRRIMVMTKNVLFLVIKPKQVNIMFLKNQKVLHVPTGIIF